MGRHSRKGESDHPYYYIRDLVLKLGEHPTSYLSNEDLTSLGIKVTNMDIENGIPSDSGPQFCDLLSSKDVDNLFKRIPMDWPLEGETDNYCRAYELQLFFENYWRERGLGDVDGYFVRLQGAAFPLEVVLSAKLEQL